MRYSTVAVGEILDVQNGYAFDSSYFNNIGKGMPVIRIRDVVRGQTNTFYSGLYPDAYVVRSGDLLIGMDGEFNIARWRSGEALLNQRVCKIIPKNGIADLSYLQYRLGLLLKSIEDATAFVTVKHLSSDDLKQQIIDLPSIEQQRSIAAALDKADRLRRTRRYAQTLSDTFLQSVFLEMFGDPVTNPKGWDVTTLGEFTEFLTSGSRGWAEHYSDQGDVFLRIQNVGKGRLLLDDLAYVNAPDTAEAKRTAVLPGDLLLSITADLGRTAVIPEGFPRAFISQHLALLRLRAIDPVFVSSQLESPGGKSQIERLDRVGVKSGLNFDDVRGLKLTLPPHELQRRFVAIVQRHERVRVQQAEATRQADHLFHSLLHRAFQTEK